METRGPGPIFLRNPKSFENNIANNYYKKDFFYIFYFSGSIKIIK